MEENKAISSKPQTFDNPVKPSTDCKPYSIYLLIIYGRGAGVKFGVAILPFLSAQPTLPKLPSATTYFKAPYIVNLFFLCVTPSFGAAVKVRNKLGL